MNREIDQLFTKILTNSLNTEQINYLGNKYDGSFNVHAKLGIPESLPIQRQNAAEALIDYCGSEENIVQLFKILLENEGHRFHNTKLKIWERDKFFKLLRKHKWIYDRDLNGFKRDPFYENEINLLKKLKIVDLRQEISLKEIIDEIKESSQRLSIHDLEWRITLRLYDLEKESSELIREIIDLLLSRQNLKALSHSIFTCLKELTINASKANYKILFEKYYRDKKSPASNKNYREFLNSFKDEIEENGNKRLLPLAMNEDKFINIVFQSTHDSISVWVINNAHLSLIEKKQLLGRIDEGKLGIKKVKKSKSVFVEGAGLGINLILSIISKYSKDPDPLKVIFYPEHVKVGFELKRSDILEALEQ